MRAGIGNMVSVAVLSVLLGAAAGLVIWLFIRAVSVGTSFVWDMVPSFAGSWAAIPICALGGCVVGLIHRRYGDYPDELDVVMGKVRREKRYDYRPMLPIIACAVIPLVLGASVGPEAGLTGIIAALCYWVGDNVSFAKRDAALYTELGEAVTLGQIFHMPLFGILAVEEPAVDGSPPSLPRISKLVLYGLSAGAGILVVWGLNQVFHTSLEGFPSFSEASISPEDFAMAVIYVVLGLAVYLLYRAAGTAAETGAEKVPVVWREAACGAVIGLMCILAPMAMFSGEDQMADLIGGFGSYAPWMLIGICLLKVLMTAFCLRFGMKGGHFFPMIFACSCMGIGIAMLVFSDFPSHVVFAAGVTTAATLGAQMRKPLAVTILLLLCFPFRMVFWLFVAAAVGGWLAQLLDRSRSSGSADAAES
ncbi:MAG: chloride channel protein [Candidatus Methanomethylophilaceae archaeon]|nr:chloride channel protein [Candidatus Methanomethylophilaceae archaeon]